MLPSFLSFLQTERLVNPGEEWLLDNGHGVRLYATHGAFPTVVRCHFKALGLEKTALSLCMASGRGSSIGFGKQA